MMVVMVYFCYNDASNNYVIIIHCCGGMFDMLGGRLCHVQDLVSIEEVSLFK